MDREAWHIAVHGVTKNRTWLNWMQNIKRTHKTLTTNWAVDLNRHFVLKMTYIYTIGMKGCSIALLIRELEIKTAMRYYLTLVRVAAAKAKTNNKCLQECREKGTLRHCWWECKVVQPLWKTVWKLTELPYDQAIPLPNIFPKKMKTLIQRDICNPMFNAALLMKKMYICTTEYYSAIKKNESLPFVTSWIPRVLCQMK